MISITEGPIETTGLKIAPETGAAEKTPTISGNPTTNPYNGFFTFSSLILKYARIIKNVKIVALALIFNNYFLEQHQVVNLKHV